MDKPVRDENRFCGHSKEDNIVFKRLFSGIQDIDEQEIMKALSLVTDIDINFKYDSIYETGADLPELVFEGMGPSVEVNKEKGSDTLTDEQKWVVEHVVSVLMFDLISCLLRCQRIEKVWDKTEWKEDYIPTDEEVA